MNEEREYLLFCDESDRRGEYFSNFYGGVLVGASQFDRIHQRLAGCCEALNLTSEIKWSKISEPYAPKSCKLIDAFFEAMMGHHRTLFGEPLDVIGFPLKMTQRYEEREIGVFNPGFLELRIHLVHDVLPDGISPGFHDHTPPDR